MASDKILQEASLKLDNQLCFTLYTGSREITRLYKPYLKQLDLTYTQYITMLVMWEFEQIPFKQLANRLYLDSGTLTPLIKKLESQGLLSRERNQTDERNINLILTPLGRALKEKALEIPTKLYCKLGYTLDDAIALREQLKALIHFLEEQSETEV